MTPSDALRQLGIDLGLGALEFRAGVCTLVFDGDLRVTVEEVGEGGGVRIHTVPARVAAGELAALSAVLLEANTGRQPESPAFGYDPVSEEIVLWTDGGGSPLRYPAFLRRVERLVQDALRWRNHLKEIGEPPAPPVDTHVLIFRP
jgi:hypothetical protein